MTLSKVKYAAICLILALFGAAIVIFPERYVEGCFNGFLMWAECVLPSLFPFMIIALIMIKTGVAERASLPLKRVTGFFKLPQSAAVCFVLSIFSGYPAGSKVVAEFYDGGALCSADCRRLAPLCSTSGPLFIIGSVGLKMFADKSAGVKIFAAHLSAVLLTSLLYSLFTKNSTPSKPPQRLKKSENLLYDTFYGAIISVAVAGGFIAFFSTFAQFLQDFNILYPITAPLTPIIGESVADAFSYGIIEATAGCRLLSATASPLIVPLAGFLITFGGVSILLQQLSHLQRTGVNTLKFISFKFFQATVCFLILLAIQ